MANVSFDIQFLQNIVRNPSAHVYPCVFLHSRKHRLYFFPLRICQVTFAFLSQMLPAPIDGGFRQEGYWVWCGSVIRAEDGRYHMFASRWPKYLLFHPSWLSASEVVRAISDTSEGPYLFGEVVLPARGPQFWDGMATHNPHITKQGGIYVLYYTGSTYPFPAPG